jgi:hypothetical protein
MIELGIALWSVGNCTLLLYFSNARFNLEQSEYVNIWISIETGLGSGVGMRWIGDTSIYSIIYSTFKSSIIILVPSVIS